MDLKVITIFVKKKYILNQYLELLKLILPEFLVEHFDLVGSHKDAEIMHLYFEERNIIPIKDIKRIIIAHGFHKSITIQDFPLRGNTVYLHIKRRRWLDKERQEIIQRDWALVAQGTRMTSDFAAFLKEINRY